VVINSAAINIAWSFYNIFAILMGILVCLERPRKRVSERIGVNEAVKLSYDEAAACKIIDISDSGVKVECDYINDVPITGDSKSVNLSGESLGDFKGNVVWSKNENGNKSFGIKFTELTTELYGRISKYIADKNNGYHDNK
jgi:hypothetical protein